MDQDRPSRKLTPALCRGARGLLDWSQTVLASRSGVSRSTIKDFETGLHELHRATETQLLAALEAGGIRFGRSEDFGTGLFLVAPVTD